MLAVRSVVLCLSQAATSCRLAAPTGLARQAEWAPSLTMGQVFGVEKRDRGLSTTSPQAAKKAAAAAIDRPQDSDPDLWLLVGLGNPGPRYEHTRHNVGFMLVDTLALAESIAVDRLQENAAVGRGRFAGKKVLLAKPMIFMNNSGESVGKLSRFYRVPPERILVVYDDLDLPTAKVRLRKNGGHGGHNGMKSIMAHLQGNKDFPRIKIGIGRPPEGGMSVASYVLQDFSKAEREEINVTIQEAIDLIRAVFTVGMERAVSGVKHDQPPKPSKKERRQQRQQQQQQQQQQLEAQKEDGGLQPEQPPLPPLPQQHHVVGTA